MEVSFIVYVLQLEISIATFKNLNKKSEANKENKTSQFKWCIDQGTIS